MGSPGLTQQLTQSSDPSSVHESQSFSTKEQRPAAAALHKRERISGRTRPTLFGRRWQNSSMTPS